MRTTARQFVATRSSHGSEVSGVPSSVVRQKSTSTFGVSSSTMAVWLLARSMMLVEVLVDDRQPRAFAGGVGQRVVGEDRPTEVEQRDQHQQEERDDEGEFDEGLAPAAPGGGGAGSASRLMAGSP